jgi:hypothetical protein
MSSILNNLLSNNIRPKYIYWLLNMSHWNYRIDSYKKKYKGFAKTKSDRNLYKNINFHKCHKRMNKFWKDLGQTLCNYKNKF